MNFGIINKHEKCSGLTLFRFLKWNVEVWYCPAGYKITPHSHPNEHVELMYVCGKATFYRVNVKDVNSPFTEHFTPRWHNMFKRFSITPGTIHWFSVSKRPLVFINFATFVNGHKPTSAANDFRKI